MSGARVEVINAALLVAYDGRPFHGWQRHPGKPTVQGALEAGLERITGRETLIEGSGRTDRGAHALGQVASVRLPASTSLEELPRRLDEVLPLGIEVLEAASVTDDFHARKAAIGKSYRYVLWNDEELPDDFRGRVWHVKRRLDPEAVERAAERFTGTHDFASFATSGGFERASTTRTLTECSVAISAPRFDIVLQADAFLYKMVRNIVRTIVRAGEGAIAPDEVDRILAAKDRGAAPGTAPATGLYLEEVHYAASPFDGPKGELSTSASD